ncbi:putative phage tail fiber protein [Photorhabdus temperata subsp. temperata M1021]|nr:putative phage tail fiber protein [Photorhabdus temperata subsp. temperata M1021]
MPGSRKVNGKALTGDISLSAGDVGAFSLGLTGRANAVPWNTDTGLYELLHPGYSEHVAHFYNGSGSCPAFQLRVAYRNGGIAYRSARDSYGFEEDWTNIYTTKNKPSAEDVGACRAYSGSINTGGGTWTTKEFIVWLKQNGAFDVPYWMCKGSWSYADNRIINDTGCGNICLAGAVVEVMGVESAMTIRVTTPTTTSGNGIASVQFTYINHGEGYYPGWRRDYNTANKPTVEDVGACRAYSGSINTGGGTWTTQEFIVWLKQNGAFDVPYWMCKGSWSYADNRIINDTGCGNICLAGAVVEVMGVESAMTIRVTTPTTTVNDGISNAQFTYINHGEGYYPGWRRDYNIANKPTAGDVGHILKPNAIVVIP